MTARPRLVALAALFAPDRAASMLARLPATEGIDAAADAARLAAAPRRERLHALATALEQGRDDRRTRAASAARLERPRVAAVLRRAGEGAGGEEPSPALARLCRERIDR